MSIRWSSSDTQGLWLGEKGEEEEEEEEEKKPEEEPVEDREGRYLRSSWEKGQKDDEEEKEEDEKARTPSDPISLSSADVSMSWKRSSRVTSCK